MPIAKVICLVMSLPAEGHNFIYRHSMSHTVDHQLRLVSPPPVRRCSSLALQCIFSANYILHTFYYGILKERNTPTCIIHFCLPEDMCHGNMSEVIETNTNASTYTLTHTQSYRLVVSSNR